MDAAGAPSWPVGGAGAACAAAIGRLGANGADACALGPVAAWPPALKGAIDLLLDAAVPMALFWGPQALVFYNDRCLPAVGNAHPQALGRPAAEGGAYWSACLPLVDAVRTSGAARTVREQPLRVRRDGGDIDDAWLDLSFSPLRDAGDVAGAVAGVLVVAVGSTERVRATAALRASELVGSDAVLRGAEARRERERAEHDLARMHDQLRLAEAAGGVGVFWVDIASNMVAVSGQFCRLFGLPEADSYPAAAIEALHVDTGTEGNAISNAAGRGTGTAPLAARYRIRRADDGALRWLARRAEFVRDAEGRPTHMRGVVQDVTDAQDAEADLRRSEARFRTLAQAMPNHAWTADAAGQLDWFNDRVYDDIGLGFDQLAGTGWGQAVHPDDLPHVVDEWTRSVAAGIAYESEFRILRADGTWRWHLVRALPVEGAGGAVSGWVGTNTDIDGQKTALAELARLNATLEERVAERTRERDRMWRLATDVMLVVRFDGGIVAVNPAWQTLLGWSQAELIGSDVMALVHSDDAAMSHAELASLAGGATTQRFENRIRHRDGSWRMLSWTAVPDEGFVHAIGRDVTAERAAALALAETEERLRQSQKMEAVGQLTGGIAHDFNNLLQAITGSLETLRARLARGDTAGNDRFLDGALTSAQRAAALTHRLLAFSRRQPLDPRTVRVGPLLESMRDLLDRTLGGGVALDMAQAEDLWPTLCDANQLENAILNLAINARDAMPGGGRLTIATSNVRLGEAAAAAAAGVGGAPGDYVCIAVTDDGTGMTPEVAARAFEPFFTTKAIGQGTGLGLSMIYGFAAQSKGACRIDSRPGHGTAVRLYLPRHHGGAVAADAGAWPAQPDPTPPPAQAGAVAGPAREDDVRSVLVVEDEPIVRLLIVDLLGELGFRMLEAADGPAALALVQGPARIDLLLTDIGLPGFDGRQLADAARLARPDLRILFMTGYAEKAAFAGGFLKSGMGLITKPFGMDALAWRVAEMLAGPT